MPSPPQITATLFTPFDPVSDPLFFPPQPLVLTRSDAWPNAWANRTNAPATWLAIGDSITEGQGASVLGNRWTSVCLNYLRGLTGMSGGAGWLSCSLAIGPDSAWTSPTSPVPVATGSALLNNYFWQTLDGKAANTNATNDTITWTVNATSFDTWVIDSTANGTYQIDSNTPVALTNGGVIFTLRVQHSAGVASASHTLQIKQTNAGVIGVDGIFVYDGDEASGIHCYNNGHYGAFTSDILNDWGTGPIDQLLYPFWLNQIAPDVVTVGFGTNEFLNNINPTTYKASLRQLVLMLQALPKMPTVYVLAMPTYDDGVTQTFRWTAYQTAMQQIVSELPGTYYVDVATVTGAPTIGGNFSTDRIHPNDTGHALIGQYIGQILGNVVTGGVTSVATAGATVTAVVGTVGNVSSTITESVATARVLGAVGSVASTITAGAVATPSIQANPTISAGATVTAVVGLIGTVTSTITAGAVVSPGAFTATVTSGITANVSVSGVVGAVGSVTSAITESVTTAQTLGVVATVSSAVTATATATPSVQSAPAVTAGAVVSAVVGRFGAVTSVVTAGATVSPVSQVLGAVTAPAVAGALVSGRVDVFGAVQAAIAALVTVGAHVPVSVVGSSSGASGLGSAAGPVAAGSVTGASSIGSVAGPNTAGSVAGPTVTGTAR